MNLMRLLLAIVVAFVFVFVSDFLIHTFWLAADYAATKELWRPDSEMTARFPWMIGAHLLIATAFVTLWALGFADRGSAGLACAYGLIIGLLVQGTTIITYVVSPLPAGIALKWFISGVVQSVLLGVVVWLTYKPLQKRPLT